jgi:elongation factor G
VVVCEPEATKAIQLMPYLKRLADLKIPTFLFVNKVETAGSNLRPLLDALQQASTRPLVLRQMPVAEGGMVTGYVDLVLERAYAYRDHEVSKVIPLKPALREQEKAARFHMLEQLADYDDRLMEELVGDIEPSQAEVCADLAREVSEGLIVPVLLGSAEHNYGIHRLLKALRHDVPGPKESLRRLGLAATHEAVLRVLKTVHTTHGGKLSLARVISGTIKDGTTVYASGGRSARIGGLFSHLGSATNKIAEAGPGETVALGRLESIVTGDVLTTDKGGPARLGPVEKLAPVYGLAIAVDDAREDVKLTAGLAKLSEEDPSILFEQNADTHELVLWGQGEIHLRVAAEKLAGRYGLHITSHAPKVPYKESIRKGLVQRGRHKRQTGGHGQFGDVVLDIQPLPRGSGFVFTEEISGGVVPRQYFSAVEAGVRDYLSVGPLGFPVVDLAVTLIDGSYHAVDSSEQAFRTAGRIAMAEALANCGPVLLEPIFQVAIDAPSEATAKVNAILSTRRGQLQGFDACEGWPGFDRTKAEIPAAELSGLIVELRSASQGVARLTFAFDHLAELTGKLADDAMARAKAA